MLKKIGPRLRGCVPEEVSDDCLLVSYEILEFDNMHLAPFLGLAQRADVVHNVLANHLFKKDIIC